MSLPWEAHSECVTVVPLTKSTPCSSFAAAFCATRGNTLSECVYMELGGGEEERRELVPPGWKAGDPMKVN